METKRTALLKWYRQHQRQARWLLLAAFTMIIVSIGIWQYFAKQKEVQAQSESLLTTSQSKTTSSQQEKAVVSSQNDQAKTSKSSIVYAEIKGAVKHPSVYRFKENERVTDLIQKAGGLTADADQAQLNLAAPLSDGLSLYVPRKGEDTAVVAEINQALGSHSSTASMTIVADESSTTNNQGAINLNQADATQLQEISGIGPKKAADIIAYREQVGAFKSVDELLEVSGIGEKTLANMRDQVCVQ